MFNQERLLNPYDHVMLIDGNDTRGIDAGIMTRSQIEIVNMRSNVDVPDPDAPEHLRLQWARHVPRAAGRGHVSAARCHLRGLGRTELFGRGL
jgi:hypothetical protein